MSKQLSRSQEDYLETIANLHDEHGVVRVKDISAALAVSKPSVVGALKELRVRKLVSQEAYGHIELTAQGQKKAEQVRERHALLVDFLYRVLQVDTEQAEEDACKIEHVMSDQTAKKLTQLMKYVDAKTSVSDEWLAGFISFLKKKG